MFQPSGGNDPQLQCQKQQHKSKDAPRNRGLAERLDQRSHTVESSEYGNLQEEVNDFHSVVKR